MCVATRPILYHFVFFPRFMTLHSCIIIGVPMVSNTRGLLTRLTMAMASYGVGDGG